MTTFAIDTEYARRLSHELFAASQGSNPPTPPLPEDASLAQFSNCLQAALNNLGSRATRLRQDLDHIARFGMHMAQEAESADGDLATTLGGHAQ